MLRGVIELSFAFAALAVIGGCATLTAPAASSASSAKSAVVDENFQKDRAAILAMTGDYDVTFSFRETVALTPDYKLKPEKTSRGHEVVRVIKDDGKFISLQHILVADGKQKMAIKHWRQDWVYEPKEIFDFVGHNAFEKAAVPAEQAKGAWAQLVYQVDDSPRYAGVAKWIHEDGSSSWQSPATWRPLPRREATTRKDYDVLVGFNRHVITPAGWAHEQDNSKLVLEPEPHILAREVGVNTYNKSDKFDATIATNYWDKTKTFWALVSDDWQTLGREQANYGIALEGETEKLYMPILELADKVATGKQTAELAAADAKKVMAQYVKY